MLSVSNVRPYILGFVGHSIKGAARTISADHLAGAAERLECLANGKRTEGLAPAPAAVGWAELVARPYPHPRLFSLNRSRSVEFLSPKPPSSIHIKRVPR